MIDVLDLDTGLTVDELREQVATANERNRILAADLSLAVQTLKLTGRALWKVQHELDALRNGQPAPVVVTLTDRGVGDGYGVEE